MMCKNIYKCPVCGSTDIEFRMRGKWNIRHQLMEIADIDWESGVMCWECGFEIEPVEEVWDSANV